MAGSGAVYEAISATLGALPGIHEKRMFGGTCFMLEGNMVCGAMKGWAMVRVGKMNEARALAFPGVEHAMPSGRKMAGFVRIHEDAMAEEETVLPALLDMALGFVATLPAK
ncbi:TfoX/Sxy family protein [Pikeienuella piscinae]|uniref:TfoX/Sxy family protein n=1 Tax=Pikeienuella piscinae TaxID=2748098 RepID=A0A7L5BWL1_9RHOB|nr:TfoX/Sxy family protein [Pikeienuella piscinae]QIE53979.1 TfoX/Sxy family protein [Pikeienuella piscinae]